MRLTVCKSVDINHSDVRVGSDGSPRREVLEHLVSERNGPSGKERSRGRSREGVGRVDSQVEGVVEKDVLSPGFDQLHGRKRKPRRGWSVAKRERKREAGKGRKRTNLFD